MICRSYFFPMNNPVLNYPWGSLTSLSTLFDIANPEQLPQAELWMGAHPNGCSKIMVEEREILLSELIATDPELMLGSAKDFAELPFLFKVLAAEKALSVQVHPNKKQALTGFAREELLGIERDAGNRNYRDANHKPELVFALTPYQAMNGFRDFVAIIEDFKALKLPLLDDMLADFQANLNERGLAHFFTAVLRLQGVQKEQAIAQLLSSAAGKEAPRYQLIEKLMLQYPEDIGLFSPLFLHTVTLKPGEAMFLDAGTPHAYIQGTGLEIMANSDNVLRAGLTSKYIDISELIDKTRFTPLPYKQLLLAPVEQQERQDYPIPVSDFCFSVYHAPQAAAALVRSAEILFAIDADVTLTHSTGENITFKKGQSVFIPAYANKYLIRSKGSVARAYN